MYAVVEKSQDENKKYKSLVDCPESEILKLMNGLDPDAWEVVHFEGNRPPAGWSLWTPPPTPAQALDTFFEALIPQALPVATAQEIQALYSQREAIQKMTHDREKLPAEYQGAYTQALVLAIQGIPVRAIPLFDQAKSDALEIVDPGGIVRQAMEA